MSYEGPIYVHMNFDHFKPIPMEKDDIGNFFVKRMCPPSKNLLYFFSTPEEDTYAKDQPCIKNKNPLLKVKFKEIINIFINVQYTLETSQITDKLTSFISYIIITSNIIIS